MEDNTGLMITIILASSVIVGAFVIVGVVLAMALMG